MIDPTPKDLAETLKVQCAAEASFAPFVESGWKLVGAGSGRAVAVKPIACTQAEVRYEDEQFNLLISPNSRIGPFDTAEKVLQYMKDVEAELGPR